MHSSGWASLSWPPVVMTLIGAAAAAHMPMDAAELAFRYIDGSYRGPDRRELDEHGGLPGGLGNIAGESVWANGAKSRAHATFGVPLEESCEGESTFWRKRETRSSIHKPLVCFDLIHCSFNWSLRTNCQLHLIT